MKIFMIIMGILTILAGIFCIANPVFTAFSISWFLGILLIISGISILVNYFGKKEGTGWDVFFGILSVLGGILLLCNYFAALFADMMIIYFIAGMITVMGITRIASALRQRKEDLPWVWAMISGVLSLLTALFAFVNPLFGIVLIDYMLAVIFIIQGINLLLFGAMLLPFGKNKN